MVGNLDSLWQWDLLLACIVYVCLSFSSNKIGLPSKSKLSGCLSVLKLAYSEGGMYCTTYQCLSDLEQILQPSKRFHMLLWPTSWHYCETVPVSMTPVGVETGSCVFAFCMYVCMLYTCTFTCTVCTTVHIMISGESGILKVSWNLIASCMICHWYILFSLQFL